MSSLGIPGWMSPPLCLGCMSYGEPGRGTHSWTLVEEQSRPFIRKAVELGINFFDTANSYSDGTSEEIVGRALKEYARRDEIVVATKVFFGSDRPNGSGLSRKAILAAIDDSLRRLGMDYVDLYQIHRWDYKTPIEETLEALNDVVRAGKARYIGASSMHAWQFAKALHLSRRHGWARFVTMQNHLNLLYREEEREMLPLCLDEGIGVIPWSPQARGRLTRDWDETSERTESDQILAALYRDNGRRRPAGGRRRQAGRRQARRLAGADRACLGDAEARRDRADRRRDQARASRRRGRGTGCEAHAPRTSPRSRRRMFRTRWRGFSSGALPSPPVGPCGRSWIGALQRSEGVETDEGCWKDRKFRRFAPPQYQLVCQNIRDRLSFCAIGSQHGPVRAAVEESANFRSCSPHPVHGEKLPKGG